jgi:predicted N-acyltransferase
MPAKTLSAHWLSHSDFHDAVERYTREERQDIERYTEVLAEHSPFRQD